MLASGLRRPSPPYFQRFYTASIQSMERAALVVTDRGATRAERRFRADMANAGLGGLGNTVKAGSDLRRGRGVRRRGRQGFEARGWLAVRSRSERVIGALESYTVGAEIRPVRGRWLWIATDAIPGRANRYRMTPELYRKSGLEQRIGPLVLIHGINGYPLLVVKNVGVNAAGKPGQAKSLRKNGLARKGQRARDLLVVFFAIPRTSRRARVSVRDIMSAEQTAMIDDYRKAVA